MNTTFGDYPEPLPPLLKRTQIRFFPGPLQLTWKHCTTSADFLSQYFSGVFTTEEHGIDVQDLTHSIAYMANELIENVIKFRVEGEVQIEAGWTGEHFVLRLRNWISEETSRRFQEHLVTLTSTDPGELLIQQIEANAESDGTGSGLGLLTLLNDYGVQLGWHFEQAENHAPVFLQTLARLPLARSAASN